MAYRINHDVTTIRASHDGQILRFEPAIQDHRLYYRLLVNERGAGSLTDEAHALQTVEYWRSQGWVPAVRCSECRLVMAVNDGSSICQDCLDAYRPIMSISGDGF